MNNQLIYSLKKRGNSYVVNKIIFYLMILFVLNSPNIYSKIIYDKNNIQVSEIDLLEYQKLYLKNYGIDLKKNLALKNIILTKQTIKFLTNNNPKFMTALDQSIEKELGKNLSKNSIEKDFLRFLKIRNEFISEYFSYEFKLNDLENALEPIDSLFLPISKNNCLTIEKLENFKNNKYFLNSLIKLLKDNSSELQTEYKGEIYKVCINIKDLKIIEDYVVRYIETVTEENFKKFIYGKIS